MSTGNLNSSSPPNSNTANLLAKGNMFILSVHEEKVSEEELTLNPELFPGCKIGDLFEIYHPDKAHKKVVLRLNSTVPIKGILLNS
jgi:hypothetical protein